MNETPSQEMKRIALKLEAIAQWQMDAVCAETNTAKLLMSAANLLNKASGHICAQGYFGCRGGDTCKSDHK